MSNDQVIEKAIYDWFAASGVPVLWSYQRAPRPNGAFISLSIENETMAGLHDYIDSHLVPLVIAPKAVVSVAGNSLTVTAHGLATGDGPIRVTTTGTLPSGLSLLTDYWVIVVDSNTLRLAADFQLAQSPTPIVLSDSGTGAHTISGTDESLKAGSELTATIQGQRKLELTATCFGGTPTPISPIGTNSPYALLKDAVYSCQLPSIAEGLTAARVSVMSINSIKRIGEKVNTILFEPRAIASVTLSAVFELSSTSTFIEVANALNQIVTPSETITLK